MATLQGIDRGLRESFAYWAESYLGIDIDQKHEEVEHDFTELFDKYKYYLELEELAWKVEQAKAQCGFRAGVKR